MTMDMSPMISRTTTLDRLVLEHGMWKNPRTVTGLDDKSLDELGDSILERGQLHDIDVVQVYADSEIDPQTGEVSGLLEGRQVLDLVLDGQRRTMALRRSVKRRKKGEGTVDVRVRDLYPEPIELTQETAKKLLLDMVAAAIERAGLDSFEQVEVANRFRDEDKKTIEEIAGIIKRSATWVSRMLRAYRLASPALLTSWRDKKLTDELFKELSEIEPMDKQEAAVKGALDLRSQGREAKSEARHSIKEKAGKEKEKRKATKKAKAKAKPAKEIKPATTPEDETSGDDQADAAIVNSSPIPFDLISLRDIKKPSDPYVKGLMDGAAYAIGECPLDEFGTPWRSYVKKLAKSGFVVPLELGGSPPTEKKVKRTKRKGK